MRTAVMEGPRAHRSDTETPKFHIESTLRPKYLIDGWLSKLRSLFGSPKY